MSGSYSKASENLNKSTLMCTGEVCPVVGGISRDGNVDEVVSKRSTGVCVRIAIFEIVDERHAGLGGVLYLSEL